MTDLGKPDASRTATEAYGVNNDGEVVGEATTSDGHSQAFLWARGSGMRDLGTLGGDGSVAYGISDTGSVIGHAQTGSGWWRAFV